MSAAPGLPAPGVAVEPFVELVRRESPATQVRVIEPGETFRLETLLA